jgi:hypothetical protein
MNQMKMPWWVFHQEQLAAALAAREAERVKQGATEQQAKDETQIIAAFLASESAARLRGDV